MLVAVELGEILLISWCNIPLFIITSPFEVKLYESQAFLLACYNLDLVPGSSPAARYRSIS